MRFAKIFLFVCFNILTIGSVLAQQDSTGKAKQDTTKKGNGSGTGGGGGGVIAFTIDNCIMNGPSSVLAGNTHTYYITCDQGDGATSWQVSGGTLNSSNAWNASVTWGSAGNGVVTAKKGLATQALMDVTITAPAPLVGGSISNTSQNINYNTTPAVINASAASGGNCGTAYVYQWHSSTNGSTYTPIASSNVQNYQPGALTTTTYYKRSVTCNGATSWTSNVATVTVYPALQAGSVAPASQNINYGANAATLSSTGVSGGNGVYTYKWFSSATTSGFTAIAGPVTTSTYTPTGLTATRYYQVEVSSNGVVLYSNYAVVNVYPQLQPGTVSPATQTINYNANAAAISVSGVSGGTGTYTYQWQSSSDGSSWSNIASAVAASYTPTGLTSTTYYRVVVSSNGAMANSNSAEVKVNLIAGSISSGVTTVLYNTTPGILNSAQNAGGGSCGAAYSYQWQSSTDGSNFSDITGATAATYTPGPMTVNTWFKRRVTCAGVTLFSNTLSITVGPMLTAGNITPASAIIPNNTSPGTLAANPASGGSCVGSYNYQWQYSTDGTNFLNVATNGTGLSYTPGNITVPTWYRRKVTTSCGTETAYTNVSKITIGTVDNESLNYIKTRAFDKPGITTLSTANAESNPNAVKQSTVYFDGLGRAIQTVAKQGSLPTATGTPTDMVSFNLYDEYGREAQQFLPFSSAESNGLYKGNDAQQQSAFNQVQFTDENFFYGQTQFEASPLNRPLLAMAPGNSWTGSNRGIASKYYFNTTSDEVRIWNVTIGATGVFSTYTSPGAYAAGLLYKSITVDEQGKQVIEFKDKDDRVILKKVQLTATADDGTGSGHANWLCTYYLYDDLGNLRCVVQPRGVEQIQGPWVLTNTNTLAEQCFRYEYDARNRMIMKKVPGAGEVYMVYDARDRLIMTQDAMMRASSKWMVTFYDKLNRPEQTGLLLNTYFGTPAKTFVQHLDAAKVVSNGTYPFDPVTPPATTYWELLTKTGYDNYEKFPTGTGLTASLNGVYTTSPYLTGPFNTAPDYAMQPVMSSQTTGMVTWTQTKVLATTSTFLYSLNFYDEKGRLIQVKSKNNTGAEDVSTTQYSWNGQPLVSVQKTEKAGAPVQTTVVVTKMTYDDLGRVTKTEKSQSHTGVSGGALSAFTTIATMEYDALGQLTNKTIGSKKDPATNTYYITRQPLQELKYDYNIRGWLLGMNRDYLATEGQTGDGKLFGFELGYDKLTNKTPESFNAAQWNGNINGMIWKSDGDDIRRKYDFTYDPVNRLLKAEFEQQNPDDHAWNKSQVNYTVQMGDGITGTSAYDANGNIKSMTQYGLKLGVDPNIPIDQLTYNYLLISNIQTNKLLNVIDAQNDPATKLGDFRTSPVHPVQSKISTTIDYTYDVNGNMLRDYNKDIGKTTANGIVYNHLNLPRVITLYKADGTVKGTITYVYDAAGNKLSKATLENNVTVNYGGTNYTSNLTTTTTYLGGVVYETKDYVSTSLAPLEYFYKLQFIGQEEGRIRYKPENTTLEYDYMIKDHLGNVRMLITEELQKDKYPVASLETTKLSIEDDYYTIDQSKIEDASAVTGLPAYTNDNGIGNNPTDVPFETANSAKLYRLNGGDVTKTGLGITLKVMSGDRIDIHGKSYYFQNNTGGTAANSAVPILEILNGLLGGPSGGVAAGAHGGVTGTQLSGYTGTTAGINTLLSNQTTDNSATPQTPKAYINYLFFDEQFKCVGNGFSKIGNNSVVKSHFSELQNLIAPKNGYVYIYASNESPVSVFFDNLQVVHTRGSILEETHYYPFGLTMTSLSSKAATFGQPENKKKYNGIEFENDLGVNIYDAELRELDQQIGRWWQIDPETENMEMWSPYVSNFDNPILYMDPRGDEPGECCDDIWDIANEILISGAGVVNGTLNTISFGAISSDPLNFRSKLNEEQKATYDRGVTVGKYGPSFLPGGGRRTNNTPAELVPVGGNGKGVSIKVETPPLNTVPLTTVQSNSNESGGNAGNKQRSASDEKLIQEAKAAKAKADAAKAREANRQTASKQGKQKTGNSNQDVRGDHNNTKKGGGKAKENDHENANARRAREQAAADAKKKK